MHVCDTGRCACEGVHACACERARACLSACIRGGVLALGLSWGPKSLPQSIGESFDEATAAGLVVNVFGFIGFYTCMTTKP